MSTATDAVPAGMLFGLQVREQPLMLRVVYMERMRDYKLDDPRHFYLKRELDMKGLSREHGTIEYSDEENIFCPSKEHEIANYVKLSRIFCCYYHHSFRVARIIEGPWTGTLVVGLGATLEQCESACNYALHSVVPSNILAQWQYGDQLGIHHHFYPDGPHVVKSLKQKPN